MTETIKERMKRLEQIEDVRKDIQKLRKDLDKLLSTATTDGRREGAIEGIDRVEKMARNSKLPAGDNWCHAFNVVRAEYKKELK